MTAFFSSVLRRVPDRKDVFQVFSIVNFLSFSWAVIVFFYYLSSWIMFMSVQELMVVFCYGVLYIIPDIFLTVTLVITLAVILPRKVMRNQFTSLGGMFVIVFFFWATSIQTGMGSFFLFMTRIQQIVILIVVITTLVGFVYITYKIPSIAKSISSFSKRLSIFVWLYGPLYIICPLVVVARNLS